MEEKHYLDQAKLKEQCVASAVRLTTNNQKLDNLKAVYNSVDEVNMEGESADGLMHQSEAYVVLIDGLKSANNCDISDHNYLASILGDEVLDGGVIIPSRNEALKNYHNEDSESNSCYNTANSLPDWRIGERGYWLACGWYHRNKADNYMEEYKYWKKKEFAYDIVESDSRNLFKKSTDYRSIVLDGFKAIAADFVDGEYTITGADEWKLKFASLNKELIDVYKKRWETGTGDYDMDKLEELIRRDPSEITPEEYLALCEVYDAMDAEEKAEFMKRAYVSTGYSYEDPNSLILCTWKYSISPAFQTFTSVYMCQMEFAVDENGKLSNVNGSTKISPEEQLANYNFLYTCAYVSPDIYVGGQDYIVDALDKVDDIHITITKTDTDTTCPKYVLSINADNEAFVQTDLGTTISSASRTQSYTIYPYRYNLDTILDQAVIAKADGLRVNATEEAVTSVVTSAIDIGVGSMLETGPGIVFSVSETVVNIGLDSIEAEETNSTIDEMQADLNAGNGLEAYGCGGTVIIDDENHAYVSTYTYNENTLKEYINDYNSITGANISLERAEATLDSLAVGNSVPDDMKDFVDWMDNERNAN